MAESNPPTITAEVMTPIYENHESGWCVARVRVKDEPGLVTAVGVMGSLTPGEVLSLTGTWKEHPKYGRQFQVAACTRSYPASENGIIRYLSSGLIKGVGEVMARRLVDAFGEKVLDILDTEPDRLLEVDGIGKKTLSRILESWGSQQELRNLLLFLQTHEVPTTYAAKIYRLWGGNAIERLREDPYELAYEIRGIGFRTADRMAMKLGFAVDSPQRVRAAVVYALFTFAERGHMFAPEAELFKMVSEMLGGELPDHLFEAALAELSLAKRIHIEDLSFRNIPRAIYLFHFYKNEQETASRLKNLIAHPSAGVGAEEVAAHLPAVERASGVTLSAEQRQAVLGACEHKAFIITGGPGTGKTTITRMIVEALKEANLSLKLCAPTGRAAKRMSEAAGLPASTIHRLLQYIPETGKFHYGEDNKLKAEAVVVDEASMLDSSLFLSLIRALPLTSRLVLVGDVDQLPSVGPGNVLADLIESEAIPTARLFHIYRQARRSQIVVNAHRVNQGLFPEEDREARPPRKDFWWIVQDDPVRVQSLLIQTVCERIPAAYGLDPMRDVQVLTPMHKGDLGTLALNSLLQERLNPSGPTVTRGRFSFRPGDRVLQLRNNYEKDVFNGDLGHVDEVDPESGDLSVDFDGRVLVYDAADLDELAPAYAVSVHKAQGSEYPAVVLPMVTQHYVLLQKNLLYTAITRARKLVVLVGSKKAVGVAIRNDKAVQRHTHLKYRLMETLNSLWNEDQAGV